MPETMNNNRMMEGGRGGDHIGNARNALRRTRTHADIAGVAVQATTRKATVRKTEDRCAWGRGGTEGEIPKVYNVL